MFGAGSLSKRNKKSERLKAEWSRRSSLMFKASCQTFILSYYIPTFSAQRLSSCPKSSLSLSLLWLGLYSPFIHVCSHLILPCLFSRPSILPPPLRLCGTGCFTSAVLTLTAPSLWRLISYSDTLSLYHANGPAHPPARVYAISTLSKTPENRETD